MDKKLKNILKIFCTILFILLLLNYSKVYATDMDKRIEMFYDKIETEEGTFYKHKKSDTTKAIVGYSTSNKVYSDENQKIVKIINEKVDEYIKKFTNENYPNEQRIEDMYTKNVLNIYSISDENPYNDGDDIVALVSVCATPVNANSHYWKSNFSNNELYYNEGENKYYVTMHYFIRLSINQETGEYQIAYIDFKPENLEQYLSDLKEKGIDLENLDVEKILNTSYEDEFKVVPSSNTVATGGNKTEYNTANVEDISKMAFLIRLICIVFLMLIITIGIRKKYKN